jgi:hypothetical protein
MKLCRSRQSNTEILHNYSVMLENIRHDRAACTRKNRFADSGMIQLENFSLSFSSCCCHLFQKEKENR